MPSVLLSLVSLLLLTSPGLVCAKKPHHHTSEHCYTVYGPKKHKKVPTHTRTIHKKITKTVIRNTHPHTTIHPTTTFTITKTKTVYDTVTASTRTDTATDTIVNTITTTTTLDTVTDTATTTETTTTTDAPKTSTEPEPAGFTGALDTLPDSELKKRSPNGDLLDARDVEPDSPDLGSKHKHKRHKKSVKCFDFVYKTKTTRIVRSRPGTITKTAHKTKTKVVKATETDTETSTLYPSATTTVTITTDETTTMTEIPDPVTVTSTETSTVTEEAPVATVYAACDPDTGRNIIGGVSGEGIVGAQGAVNTTYFAGPATGAADCCNQCFALTGKYCGQFAYNPIFSSSCFLDIADSQPTGDTCVYTSPSKPVDGSFKVGNGPQNFITSICGESSSSSPRVHD